MKYITILILIRHMKEYHNLGTKFELSFVWDWLVK